MKLSHTFLAMLASILLTSCFKEPMFKPVEPKLPEATQQGLNTFGCYKNGELWLPGPMGGEGFYTPYLWAVYLSKTNEIKIEVGNNNEYLYFSYCCESGSHLLIDSLNTVEYYNAQTDCSTYNVFADSCFFNITKFDTANQIISGVFQVFFPDSCGIANSFTEGRFDLKFSKN